MDFDAEFNEIYEHISHSISFGKCNEMVIENIDDVLSMIWDQEGSTGGIYESLTSDKDKETFLKDFRSAAQWLMGWNRCDLDDADLKMLAEDIVLERGA